MQVTCLQPPAANVHQKRTSPDRNDSTEREEGAHKRQCTQQRIPDPLPTQVQPTSNLDSAASRQQQERQQKRVESCTVSGAQPPRHRNASPALKSSTRDRGRLSSLIKAQDATVAVHSKQKATSTLEQAPQIAQLPAHKQHVKAPAAAAPTAMEVDQPKQDRKHDPTADQQRASPQPSTPAAAVPEREQTAYSRDRSRPGTPNPETRMPADPTLSDHKQLLLDIPQSIPLAAQSLADVSMVPPCLECPYAGMSNRIIDDVTAVQFVSQVFNKAREYKHKGSDRYKSKGNQYDGLSLCHTALSGVAFLEYVDWVTRLRDKLQQSGKPVDKLNEKLPAHQVSDFLLQTAKVLDPAIQGCSNAKAPDVAKQAIRMLLERLSAICHMRSLQAQQKHLQYCTRRIKQCVANQQQPDKSLPISQSAQQQQQQQQPQKLQTCNQQPRPPLQNGKTMRPSQDDSMTSCQDTMTAVRLPTVDSRGVEVAHAREVQEAERKLLSTMQNMLKMTECMHQTVMRLQQFLESPEVMGNKDAKQAAVHISALGVDAGMYGMKKAAAHARAAVACIMRLLKALA